MLLKQKDLMMSEKKVNNKPVDCAALNQLSQDFKTRFVPQTDLPAKKDFWSQNSVNFKEPNLSTRPTQVEVPKELPKAVEQHRVDSKGFQVKMNKVLNENERILEQAISKDIVNIVVTSTVNNACEPVYECERCVKLKTELQKDFIKREKLLKIDVAPLAPKLQNNRTAHHDYLKHTQEETTTLREIVEHERPLNPFNTSLDYACKFTKRIHELLIILKQTCPCINDLGDKLMAVTPINKTKKFRFTKPVTSSGNKPIKTLSSSNVVSNNHMLSSTGVTLTTSASGSHPSSNTKKDKILQTTSSAKKNKLEAYPMNVRTSLQNNKSVVNTKNIAYVPESKLIFNMLHVVQIILWYLDSDCSKYMTEDHSQLTNFVNKFLGIVKFEGLGHNLFSVGQFCELDLEVAFRQHTCFIRNLEGVDLLIGSQGNNLYTMSLGDMIAQGFVRGLPKLKFEKDHLCYACAMGKSKKKSRKPKSKDTNQEKLYLLYMDLCGPMQAVAAACYTQNRFIIRLRHGKTPYEILHGNLPDLSLLHIFGVLCYPTNGSENLGKLQPKADIGIFICYAPTKKAFWIYNRRTRRIIETIHVDFDELTAMAS
uniref:Integrase, catalytic region, zinc finger, CCHC-type, peptidase aspartic, catalytic n=1 Tax=Tanacetum cinerariifolium TaxID=118510 RepID=A0A699J4W9_TANCI|nr:integrase, catalytic region, zinc finger, CCHC-type, peptidase aspartic, catalytic [Tanacetum cinerariifolium]